MKIVVALGGNALGSTLQEQMQACRKSAKAIVDLIEEGHEVVLTHGNGPQVGMIKNAFDAHTNANGAEAMPLSVCVAMSQGYIGHDLQNALREELLDRGINKPVSTVLTQVSVSAGDPAFLSPTKPIGQFVSKEEAEALAAQTDHVYVEDSGRGYRRVVASPKPETIIEIDTVRALLEKGHVVISAGGGGIPVIAEGHHLRGIPAVIDKDFAAAKLAELISAELLIILTAVEKVAVNFGKPGEQWLDSMTVQQAHEHCSSGQFAPGSMLPKVEASIAFVRSATHRQALITKLEKAKEGIQGTTGTRIHA